MSMQDQPYHLAEILTTPINATFDPEAVWKDAKLLIAPDEFSNRLRAAGRQGVDFNDQLTLLETGADDSHDTSGLIAFIHWLLTQRVQGPKVRTRLRHLLSWEYSRLQARSVDEKDEQFLKLAQRLRQLPLAESKGRPPTLGDLVPESFLFRTGRSELNLKLTRTPPRSLDLISPMTEIDRKSVV